MIHHAGVVYRLSFLQFDVDFTARYFPLRHIPVNPKRMSKRFIQIPPAKWELKKHLSLGSNVQGQALKMQPAVPPCLAFIKRPLNEC